jgi:organic radical activating enzyme
MKYPVHERFFTFQGEGVHTGKRAFFVRLFGCPVHCPWCDSAGTWHPDWVPAEVDRMEVDQIQRELIGSRAEILVITGGEPAVHDLEPLTELIPFPIRVHLETSGGFEIKGIIDWVTLSPKRWKPPLGDNVIMADEFKFIIERPADIQFYFDMIKDLGYGEGVSDGTEPIWLHPEWSHREDPAVLEEIIATVKTVGPPFRAGWQLHKLYAVDAKDGRSRPLVPLGGNPDKGL